MKKKRNEFEVVSFENDEIILEEDKTKLSPFALFFFRHGRLITSLFASIAILTFIGAITLTLSNLPQVTPPVITEPGVIMEFDGSDNNIEASSSALTKEYAENLFESIVNNDTPDTKTNKVVDIIEVGNDKILIFDDGSAVIVYEDEDKLPIYIADKDNIKVEDNEIIIEGEIVETIDNQTLPDGTNIYEFENGKVLVEKDDEYYLIDKDDIVYDEDGNIIEEDPNKDDLNTTDFSITNNTESETLKYRVVIEETDDYNTYNRERLLPQYIYYKLSVNKDIKPSYLLNNNIWQIGDTLDENTKIEKNTYILYEGEVKQMDTDYFKLGLWVDYETIGNDMQDKSFIGTIKVYAWME